MADEMDKFVLQYTVEMKDAIERLEKLNQKVESVVKTNSNLKRQFEELSRGAVDELGKVVPGVDKVSAAVKLMSGEFAIATLAVAALAAGIKATMAMREQYNTQRVQGMETGVSGIRIEDYQRKIAKASAGTVSRDTTIGEVKKFSEMIGAAYADPTRMGTQSKQLKMLGIDPGQRGKGSTSTNDALSSLATTFAGKSSSDVQGLAKSIGMSQDFALALQKVGPEIGKITTLTEEEIKSRIGAEASVTGFNKAITDMNEQFRAASNVLGQELIPFLTKLTEMFAGIAGSIPAVAKGVKKELAPQQGERIKPLWEKAIHFNPFNAETYITTYKAIKGAVSGVQEAQAAKAHLATPEGQKAAEKSNKAADKLVSGLDEINKQGLATATEMSLAVNMFAGAVSSFANAIDEKQVWAAWAGEIGKAASMTNTEDPMDVQAQLAKQMNGSNGAGYERSTDKYDAIFRAEGKRNGVDADLLKRVTKVESGFNPNIVSGAGAVGLMQLMPANNKALGVTNAKDPAQNIAGGAKLLAMEIKAAGGDIREGLMRYHAGPDKSGWGPLTRAYPDKVLGSGVAVGKQGKAAIADGIPTGDKGGQSDAAAGVKTARDAMQVVHVSGERLRSMESLVGAIVKSSNEPDRKVLPVARNKVAGETRADINRRSVQTNIASTLGVPVGQIQHGGINSGDVEMVLSQSTKKIQNQGTALAVSLQNQMLTATERSKIMTDVRDQSRGLMLMQKYGGESVERAQEGPRSITIGERAVWINVNSTLRPEETAQAISDQFSDQFSDVVIQAASGIKY